MGRHLAENNRLEPGLQLLQTAIDIEDFNVSITHKCKQARKNLLERMLSMRTTAIGAATNTGH
jgi:hypothetical protein